MRPIYPLFALLFASCANSGLGHHEYAASNLGSSIGYLAKLTPEEESSLLPIWVDFVTAESKVEDDHSIEAPEKAAQLERLDTITVQAVRQFLEKNKTDAVQRILQRYRENRTKRQEFHVADPPPESSPAAPLKKSQQPAHGGHHH